MPIIRVNEAALYYEEHGTGSETIIFAHGLPLVLKRWRVLPALVSIPMACHYVPLRRSFTQPATEIKHGKFRQTFILISFQIRMQYPYLLRHTLIKGPI